MNLCDSHEWLMWQATQLPFIRSTAVVGSSQAQEVEPTPVAEVVRKRERRAAWAERLQKRVNAWVKGNSDDTLETMLGYEREELVCHIERQFRRGMSWSNYAGHCAFKSERVWVIDHIVPKSRFHIDDAAAAFALTNLRPLWIKENILKNVKRTHLI